MILFLAKIILYSNNMNLIFIIRNYIYYSIIIDHVLSIILSNNSMVNYMLYKKLSIKSLSNNDCALCLAGSMAGSPAAQVLCESGSAPDNINKYGCTNGYENTSHDITKCNSGSLNQIPSSCFNGVEPL